MKNNTPKVNKSRERKVATVAKFSEKINKAKAMIFTNYQGMTHVQLEHLKKGLKSTAAELVVTKNTLLKKALETTGQRLRSTAVDSSPSTVDWSKGPTATLFIYDDPIAPIKELAKSIKNIKLPLIKFGFLEGQQLAETEILRLSTLPTREVLLAQLVGGLKSPLFGLHRALTWNMQKLVMTLKAISDKKQAISS